MNISAEDKKKITNRLRRAEGQIRGIEKLVDQDAAMDTIIIQMKAVKSALQSVIWILLDNELSVNKEGSAEEQLENIKKDITRICKLLN
jgi:DNA-binding FrmR family transcriptional regulator